MRCSPSRWSASRVEIVCRYFFDISFSIITPLNEWSLVYLTFVGVAWLQREGGHTSDDSIVTLLPPWVNWTARRLGWVLAIVTCGLLTWYGTLATWDNYSKNTYDFFKLPDVPIFYVYLIIPIREPALADPAPAQAEPARMRSRRRTPPAADI